MADRIVAGGAVILGLGYLFNQLMGSESTITDANRLDIKVITTERECNAAVATLRSKLGRNAALGLDCEWYEFKGSRNPVALLQLATNSGYCVLIRLCQMSGIPSSLRQLLSDKSVTKVGVEIRKDASYLTADYDIQCNGIKDLRDLQQSSPKKKRTSSGNLPMGLETMGATYLGASPYKSVQMSRSDWEATSLTTDQVNYAAMDAYIAAKLYNCFV